MSCELWERLSRAARVVDEAKADAPAVVAGEHEHFVRRFHREPRDGQLFYVSRRLAMDLRTTATAISNGVAAAYPQGLDDNARDDYDYDWAVGILEEAASPFGARRVRRVAKLRRKRLLGRAEASKPAKTSAHGALLRFQRHQDSIRGGVAVNSTARILDRLVGP